MQSFVITIVALSVPALLLGAFRRTWWWSIVLWIGGMILGMGMGWLQFTDWIQLPIDTALILDSQGVLAWLVWSVLVAHAVPVSVRTRKEAVLLGLCLGSIGGVLALQHNSIDDNSEGDNSEGGSDDASSKSFGFVWLTLIGALAHPGTMIGGVQYFNGTWQWVLLWPVAVCMFFLSKWIPLSMEPEDTLPPSQSTSEADSISPWWMLAGGTLLMTVLMPIYATHVLLGTSIVWCVKARSAFPWKQLLSLLGTVLTVNLAVGVGLAESVAWGLEEMPMNIHQWLPLIVLCVVVVLTTIVGSIPMAIFGMALFVRTMDLASIGLTVEPLMLAFGFGVVVGNMDSFIWTNSFPMHLRRLVSGVLSSLLWLGCMVMVL